jgi:hypothetical protein
MTELNRPLGHLRDVAQSIKVPIKTERSLNMAQEANQHDEVGARLASPDEPTHSRSHKRPGCVTAYAILLGIGAGLAGLFGIWSIVAVIVEGTFESDPVLLTFFFIFLFAIAILDFLLARGLWRLKNWARIAIIVLQSLGVLFALLGLCATFDSSGSDAVPAICGTVIGLGISGYIIYWFASHGEYFD